MAFNTTNQTYCKLSPDTSVPSAHHNLTSHHTFPLPIHTLVCMSGAIPASSNS